MKTNLLLSVLALGFATATAARADFAVSTGYDYTTGKYGYTEPTQISTWNATAEYAYEAWSARIYVPHERVTSPVGTVIIAGRPRLTALLNARNQSKTETVSGVGDVETSISFDATHGSEKGWSAVFTGTVKFATADEEKGLGTGKRDFGLGVTLARNFDRLTPSIGFGYRFVGKPEGSDLKNYAYGSVGLGWWATDTTNLSLSFDTYQASSKSSGVDNEVSLGLNQNLGKHWDFEIHALAGLSTNAPDYGTGASLRFSF
ncbi:MAG: hypothetical protein QM715_04345 [Nibricoccus sp.]